MFVRPDANQFQALARLAKSTDGEVLLNILDTELRRLQTNMLDSSGEVTLKLQGMAREVTDLIGLLRGAPETAEKLRQPKA